MRDILVFGRTGQLAVALAEAASTASAPLRFVGRNDADLRDLESVRRAILATAPGIVLNAAAYTDVDRAEAEPSLARRVNAEAPAAMARAAREIGATLVHVSTDYVFGGDSPDPYVETAPTRPLNVYGRTKLEGEDAIRTELDAHVIVRTSWVYSAVGRNFVTAMLDLARRQKRVRVIDDQRGCPTSAYDLAKGLLRVTELSGEIGGPLAGTFHLAGTGETSWAGLARQIFVISARLGAPHAEVEPIASSDWPTPAARPRNSRLDSGRFAASFGFRCPHWQDSLASVITRIIVDCESTNSLPVRRSR